MSSTQNPLNACVVLNMGKLYAYGLSDIYREGDFFPIPTHERSSTLQHLIRLFEPGT